MTGTLQKVFFDTDEKPVFGDELQKMMPITAKMVATVFLTLSETLKDFCQSSTTTDSWVESIVPLNSSFLLRFSCSCNSSNCQTCRAKSRSDLKVSDLPAEAHSGRTAIRLDNFRLHHLLHLLNLALHCLQVCDKGQRSSTLFK